MFREIWFIDCAYINIFWNLHTVSLHCTKSPESCMLICTVQGVCIVVVFFYCQRTPLFMAAGGGHTDIVKYFVNVTRADVTIKDVFEVHK